MKLLTKTALALMLGAAFSAQAGQAIPAPVDQPYPGTIVMKVDASNTAQNFYRIQQNPLGIRKGYDPYDSGQLVKKEWKKKKDLRKLSEWLKSRKPKDE